MIKMGLMYCLIILFLIGAPILICEARSSAIMQKELDQQIANVLTNTRRGEVDFLELLEKFMSNVLDKDDVSNYFSIFKKIMKKIVVAIKIQERKRILLKIRDAINAILEKDTSAQVPL